MKFFQLALILYIATMLSGCTATEDISNSSPYPVLSPALEDTDLNTTYDEIDSECVDETPKNSFYEEARAEFSKLYDTSHVFVDMYMSEKAWLIGEQNIVQIISFTDFNDATVLARDNIERIEHSSFGNAASITVFDKTGQTLSLMVSPDELFTISELLK